MTADHERLRAVSEGPADLAALLPYLVETYPSNGIVLIAVTGHSGRLGKVMTAPVPEDPGAWPAVAECGLEDLVRAAGPELTGVLACLCREPGEGETGATVTCFLAPLHTVIEDACTHHDLPLFESLCLSAGCWWSYTGSYSAAEEGTPLRGEDPPPAVATAVYAGIAPAPRSEDIAATFTPVTGERAAEQRRALDEAQRDLATQLAAEGREAVWEEIEHLVENALKDFQRGAEDLDAEVAARLLIGLLNVEVRDRGFEHCEPGELAASQRLWRCLARRCVPSYASCAAPALTLLGWTALCAGDRSTARVALDHALDADAEYTMAQLLSCALRNRLPLEPLREVARTERARRRAERT
ncbi:DUF4192 domain-containing protein [Streptomyces armeniacus]|uniref:DUF4192 domain-containing protein n=1 Tax=Streptomyces armeniacus TaxID=83291 RepID=A0A345XVW8_9ACTN|nr:DUF4192 domain-containing protein [Streptomyces armeniacus]AXK35784.1 DUF4192 domain-containing protein [Streptomyces armeniacus]